MTTLSLYKRVKAGDRWKYQRILEGRGHHTNDLTGPFYARPFFDGKQFWKTLSAETFAEARDEADHFGSAFAAKAKLRLPGRCWFSISSFLLFFL
jgi:hypothetical protein